MRTIYTIVLCIITHAGFAQYGAPFNGVPDTRDAVIYQVNMRAFSTQHNFQGVIARLDSIRALGVNVIYLMPIHPIGVLKTVNSPYCVKNYTAIGAEYGTLADLQALVEAAHARGMSVMLDWIANHTAWDHAWIIDHKDWYLQDGAGNVVSPPGMGWNDVAQLNFNNAAMRLQMIQDMKYWVTTANVDGFRCDYATGPPNDFWVQVIDTLRNIPNRKLLLLAEASSTTKYTAGFDYIFGFSFYNSLHSIYSNNGSVQQIDDSNASEYTDANNHQLVTRYLTNHDVNGSDGTPLQLFGGKKGSMAAFVVATYMKSVPFIYNGQEVAFPTQIPFPFTSVKIDWAINPDVTAEYKKVIGYRNSSDALRRGVLSSFSSFNVCAFSKTLGTDTVLVFSNLRNSTINYSLPLAIRNTSWYDAFTGSPVSLDNTFSLTAYEYRVLNNAPRSANCTSNTLTWVGSISDAWETPGNWSCGRVPDSASHVILNTGAMVTLNSNTAIATLTLNKGALLNINPANDLTILKQ